MRDIVKPNGEVYARVHVVDGQLRIQLTQTESQPTIIMDAKIIPQLRQILAEAEFLKYV